MNGIWVEFLSTGIFSVIGWKQYGLSWAYEALDKDSTGNLVADDLVPKRWKVTHNGVLLSTFGSTCSRVRGVAIGGIGGWHDRVFGIALHGVRNVLMDQVGVAIAPVNEALQVRGVQIGLFNRTHRLVGLQVGLWNRSADRSLPLINWGMRTKPRKAVGP